MKHRSTYDRVLPYILASKRDVENRIKKHDRDMANQQIFNLIDFWVKYYNEAWNNHTKGIKNV